MAHLQKKYGISNEKIAEATRIVNKDRALAQSRAALRQRIASEALSPAELENEALEPKESS
jgi:hypothetical protein